MNLEDAKVQGECLETFPSSSCGKPLLGHALCELQQLLCRHPSRLNTCTGNQLRFLRGHKDSWSNSPGMSYSVWQVESENVGSNAGKGEAHHTVLRSLAAPSR